MMMVDQLGESLRVGFVADMQGGKPVELASRCAWACLSHLGDAEIDAVGEDGRKQQELILRGFSGLDMSEVPAEACPAVHLQQ